jgi:hypothetical protein
MGNEIHRYREKDTVVKAAMKAAVCIGMQISG